MISCRESDRRGACSIVRRTKTTTQCDLVDDWKQRSIEPRPEEDNPSIMKLSVRLAMPHHLVGATRCGGPNTRLRLASRSQSPFEHEAMPGGVSSVLRSRLVWQTSTCRRLCFCPMARQSLSRRHAHCICFGRLFFGCRQGLRWLGLSDGRRSRCGCVEALRPDEISDPSSPRPKNRGGLTIHPSCAMSSHPARLSCPPPHPSPSIPLVHPGTT